MKKEIIVFYTKLSTDNFPDYAKYAFSVEDNKIYEKVSPLTFLLFKMHEENEEIFYTTHAYSMVKLENGSTEIIETYLDEAININNEAFNRYNNYKFALDNVTNGELNTILEGDNEYEDELNMIHQLVETYINNNAILDLKPQFRRISNSLLFITGQNNFHFESTTDNVIDQLQNQLQGR